jgi:PAT family beta-lactamase induction signal transducer AmpG
MSEPAGASWKSMLTVYGRRPVIAMLFLGFSAGLPFMLVFGTLTAWLREAGVTRTAIGFFSWIGITYSIKILWAPAVDRLRLPLLTRVLGKRRGWMLAGQIGVAAGLVGMAGTDPTTQIWLVAGFALLVAFSSATQDVAMDAFRIESEAARFQGAMASTYQLGYRIAVLASYAGALYLAALTSWRITYMAMAALMAVGMLTVALVPEPEQRVDSGAARLEARAIEFARRRSHWPDWARDAGAWFIGAVVCPLADFFQRYGRLALAILALVAVFRITDIAMAAMANPLYIDLGFSKTEIADISGFYGVFMTMLGAFAGGAVVARYGLMPPLLVAAVTTALTNLLFAWLAATNGGLWELTIVISAENFSGGFAGSAFIAWLSSLTSRAYTATQYALFSSLMTLPGKFLSGFGGIVVDGAGYPFFFILTALLGLPAILLAAFLMQRRAAVAGGAAAEPDSGQGVPDSRGP